MFAYFDKIARMDGNVRKVAAYRSWTMLAGLLVVVFVPRFLSSTSQGYYYTFQSIVFLQVLFDLGLAQTIAQIASHEFAHLDDVLENAPSGGLRRAKLSYIKVATLKWYRWTSGLFVIVISLFGTAYFTGFGNGFAVDWFAPWIVLVLATGANLLLSPRIAIVEGAGWTGAAADLRLFQSVLGHIVMIACLTAGGELWSIVAVPVTAAGISFAWLRWSRNPYRSVSPVGADAPDHRAWRGELLGLQWRVAVAWLGGYLASQILVPIIFAVQGATAAGRIGLGLQIFNAVQSFGMSWVSARIPRLGHLISRGELSLLRDDFRNAAISATAVTAVVALSVAIVLELASARGSFLADRIPSAFAIVLLAGIAVLNTIIYALAAYMRAHKEEPLVVSSIFIGMANTIGALICAGFGSDAVVGSYGIVTLCINLPWTIIIFDRYYRRNHGGRNA